MPVQMADFLPSWASFLVFFGFVCGVLTAGMNSLATVTARKQALQEANGDRPSCLAKGSVLGIFIVGGVFDMVGLRLTPLALLACTSAFGIPMTAFLTSETEGMAFEQRLGAALVFVALLIVPSLGPHVVEPDFGLNDFLAVLESWSTLPFLAGNVLCIVAALSLAWIWRDQQLKRRNEVGIVEPQSPLLVPYSLRADVLVWCYLASDTSAWAFLLTKISMAGVFNLSGVRELLDLLPLLAVNVAVLIVLPKVVLTALGRFPSAIIVPVYQTTTMLLVTVHGGVFLGEFSENFTFQSFRGTGYVGAYFLAVVGIWQLHADSRAVNGVGLAGKEGLLHSPG